LPLASLIGNPLSGWIMVKLSGFHGYSGWQWLFLLEGTPSILLGAAALYVLPKDARSARWLTSNEKRAVTEVLAMEPKVARENRAMAALVDCDVWKLAFVNLTLAVIFIS
jgi:hypothetical protein